MTTTTGLTGAASIPVGATITAAYWTVPNTYGVGPAFTTEAEAIEAGIAHAEVVYARAYEYGVEPLIPETFSVDLRWTLAYPTGGSLDTVVSRTTYESLAAARARLTRLKLYTRTGAL